MRSTPSSTASTPGPRPAPDDARAGLLVSPAGPDLRAARSARGALCGGTARRLAERGPRKVGVPVICIGNINAGGTGKTPTTIALAAASRDRGRGARRHARPWRALEGPVLVEELRHRASDTGDEALLLAAFAKTWVAKDGLRARAPRSRRGRCHPCSTTASRTPRLHMICRSSWWMPPWLRQWTRASRGARLREPVETGLARADLVLSIGPEAAQRRFAETDGASHLRADPRGRLKPLPTGLPLRGLPFWPSPGSGTRRNSSPPARDGGRYPRRTRALSDHQPLSDTLMTRMLREAAAIGAQVVTTEKDAVRLSPEFRPRVLTVPVRLEIADWSQLDAKADRIRRADLSPPVRAGHSPALCRTSRQIVVLAQFRRRPVRRDLGVGKPEGRAHARHAVGLRPHPPCDHLRDRRRPRPGR
jgi:tetraacyldisaccharide 4'-kinase